MSPSQLMGHSGFVLARAAWKGRGGLVHQTGWVCVRACTSVTLHLCVKRVLGVWLAEPAPELLLSSLGEGAERGGFSPGNPTCQAVGYMARRTVLFSSPTWASGPDAWWSHLLGGSPVRPYSCGPPDVCRGAGNLCAMKLEVKSQPGYILKSC